MKCFLLTPVEEFLCCALADDAAWHATELAQWWRAVGDDAAWESARLNRASPIVALALARVVPAGELPARWTEAADGCRARIGLFMEQLDRVAMALARDGIPVVALKNSGIARGLFPDLAGSPMGDVDVLVEPAHFRRAHGRMLELGFVADSRSPLEPASLEEAEREGGIEYTFALADGSTFWFELQWRPIAGRWIQPSQEPPAGELMSRSVPIPGSAARLLSPEDNLLQVCLHTAKHSYVRAPGFRLHTDVDRIVRRCAIDWPTFVARVEAMRVTVAVYLALALPQELLRTPVPPEVLARLRPAGVRERWLRRSLARAGLFDPDRKKWSKSGYIMFNLALYDSGGGILRALFPPPQAISQRYGVTRRWTLPWWYVVRLLELTCKRAST